MKSWGAGRNQGLHEGETRQRLNVRLDPSSSGTCMVMSTVGCGREGPALPPRSHFSHSASPVACVYLRSDSTPFLTFFLTPSVGKHFSSSHWQPAATQRLAGLVFPVGPETPAEVCQPLGLTRRNFRICPSLDISVCRQGLKFSGNLGLGSRPPVSSGVTCQQCGRQPQPVSTSVQGLGDLSVLPHDTNDPRK